MTFELHHASRTAFLVPNHQTVTVKLRGERAAMNDWLYRGFDDGKRFILLTKNDKQRWIPIESIAYIEQSCETEE